ncbi:MAG: CvpA family protein [Clostridia bacterium]|nr:CvpA family protein [Pyramidobacter sp.]MBR0464888.1 CvpA family protein [Clostridia bacterium]
MNIVDIIILAILALSMVSGMYKGFITSTLALVGFVGAWIGSMATYQYLVAAIRGNETLLTVFSGIANAVDLNIGSLGNLTVFEATSEQIDAAVNSINVPLIGNLFKSNVVGQVFKNMGIDTLSEYLGETILSTALNVICFVLMFVVIYAAVLLLVNLLNNVFRFPALRHADWLLGGVFGLVRGVIILLLICAVVSPLSEALKTMNVSIVSDLIADSKFASIFFENNILESVLEKLTLA